MADLYLFRAALKDLLLPRKLVIALLLAALPSIIVFVWRGSQGSGFTADIAYNVLAGDLIFGFVLAILAVVYSTGVVTQEIEGKTIVYLLSRPMPRWRILMAKFAAAILMIVGVVWLSSLLLAVSTYGPGNLGKTHLLRDLAILPVGAVAYGALFLFLAVILKRPLLTGLLFAFGWESWVPTLGGSFEKASIIAYLRALAPHPKPESDLTDLAGLLMAANPATISRTLAWQVLIGLIVVGLGLAITCFAGGEFTPREDAE